MNHLSLLFHMSVMCLCNENQKSVCLLQSTHARWERLPGYSNVRDGLIVCITHCLLFFQDSFVCWLQWQQPHNSLFWLIVKQSKTTRSFESESDLVISFGCEIAPRCPPLFHRHGTLNVWDWDGTWSLIHSMWWAKHLHKMSRVFFFQTSRCYFKNICKKIT